MKCVDCSNGTVFSSKYCSNCLSKAKQRSASRYKAMKESRICKLCLSKLGDSKGIYCEACKDKQKSKLALRKASGICVVCGSEPSTNGQKCKDCYDTGLKNVHLKKSNRLSLGLCAYCDSKRVSTQLCKQHYLQFTSKFHLGTSKRYQELDDLFNKQNGTCPYTGRKLTIGLDCSVDHIIPKSRGGSKEIDNLQWVYAPINFMKQNMLNSEFLALVAEIYNHTMKEDV